jgi:drug/metabolite transporter (DMT)-like permease
MSPLDWGLLAALSVLWGGAFCLGQIALADLPPFTIILCRVALAAMVLIALTVAIGQPIRCPARTWPAVGALALLNIVLPFTLLLWSQARIGTGLTSVLAATTPLFSVLVTRFMTVDEPMTLARFAGVLTGFAGVAVAIGPGRTGDDHDLAAGLATLGAALCYAFAAIIGRRLSMMPPLPLASAQLAASTVLLLPIALLLEPPWTVAIPGVRTWAALLALSLLSTALGYVLFFRLLAATGVVNTSLVSFLVPVTALFLSNLVLGEELGWNAVAGSGLILLGLAVLRGRRRK